MCVSRLDGARHQWDALGTEDLGMKTRLLLGTVWLGVACSSGETAPTQSGRPSGDGFGVRVAGGEASDFGNGEQEICAGTSMSTVLTEQEAEEAGLDVEADRALLAMPHVATLRWNPVECEAEPELCEPTELELHAQVVEPILLKVERSHPDSCPEEDQHFAYRVAVSIESEDGNIAGTFYDTVIRDESEDGVVTFRGGSWPHLWNFEGDLPIELDLEALQREEPDRDRLRELFLALEFHTLVRDYAAPEPESRAKTARYDLIQLPEQVVTLVDRIRALGRLSLDTETSDMDPMRADLVGISIAVEPGEAYYLPLRHIVAAAEEQAATNPASAPGASVRQ